MAEFGTVYRYEQSGELHGLTRVRGFTQDDAHIFCRPEQVKEEFIAIIDLVQYILAVTRTGKKLRKQLLKLQKKKGYNQKLNTVKLLFMVLNLIL
jgi:threonyl-tRNA synthetase